MKSFITIATIKDPRSLINDRKVETRVSVEMNLEIPVYREMSVGMLITKETITELTTIVITTFTETKIVIYREMRPVSKAINELKITSMIEMKNGLKIAIATGAITTVTNINTDRSLLVSLANELSLSSSRNSVPIGSLKVDGSE